MFRPEQGMRAQVTLDDVGVVAAGRNECNRLKTYFASVTASVGDVAYVDSGSTNGNMATAAQYGALVERMDLTSRSPQPGRAMKRSRLCPILRELC